MYTALIQLRGRPSWIKNAIAIKVYRFELIIANFYTSFHHCIKFRKIHYNLTSPSSWANLWEYGLHRLALATTFIYVTKYATNLTNSWLATITLHWQQMQGINETVTSGMKRILHELLPLLFYLRCQLQHTRHSCISFAADLGLQYFIQQCTKWRRSATESGTKIRSFHCGSSHIETSDNNLHNVWLSGLN
jgi:hypothetical protein